MCITVKGSRVCKYCNVLDVRKYVRTSMVQGYTRIQSILDFPLPTVKISLGTVNYLRDSGRNHSVIVKSLHYLIANYDKTRRIVWTPETTAAFHEMKLQVSKCSTIHFMSDTAPITLHTDASDYGVGGYLFQTVDGIDQPVAFISKSLNKFQLRWSVIQMELYGIFHSCIYLQSLLCDRLSKIRIDHRYLLSIKEASNPMIGRWYMALSEFSFTLEFIPSVKNDIADAMSRLCLTRHKNILKNTFFQQFRHQPNQTNVRSQRLASCTTQKLAILDLNVHLNVSRIGKVFGSFSDST